MSDNIDTLRISGDNIINSGTSNNNDDNNNNNNNNNIDNDNISNSSSDSESNENDKQQQQQQQQHQAKEFKRELSIEESKINNSSNDSYNINKDPNWFQEFTEQFQILKELNESLKEKNLQLIHQQELSENKIDTLKKELDNKTDQLNTIENKLINKEEDIKELKYLNEELYKWKETHRITDEDYIKLKETIRLKDDNISSLSIQLEHTINKNLMLTESLKEVGDRGSGNVFERDETFNISSASKQLLDYQKMLSYHKIKSIEEKYTTIKNINLGLQKRIQELALENEKYKYTIETIIKSSK